MSPVEIAAAIATLLNVYLTARNRIWCWPWGIASVVLYGFVFYSGGLFSSMALQVVYYLPMQFFGWWIWLRGGPQHADDLPITTLTSRQRLVWFGVNIPLAALLGYGMSFTGAKLTYADAFVTALSVTGQLLMTYKVIEHWIFWLVVNVLYAFYILPAQKLYVSAVLYVVLLFLAVKGLVDWRAILNRQRAEVLLTSGTMPLRAES